MGRGLVILGSFAVLAGISVYLAPLKLRSEAESPSAAIVERQGENTAPVVSSDNEPTHVPPATNSNTVEPTLSVPRKSESPSNDRPQHEPVLVATAPKPTTALAALPEKTIPGFPAKPQRELSNDQFASILKQTKYLQSKGQIIEARDLLSNAYLNNRLSTEQRNRLADELHPIAWEILRSHAILENGQLYEVQAGDVLIKVAKHFHVPPEFIMRLNGLKNAKTLRAGQKLKLVQGPFDILADLQLFELTVLQRGTFVRRYAIGIGRSDSPTPLGLFKVGTKLQQPTYYPPPSDTEHRKPIAAGQADNPLGTRWIDIGLGYGIHGTIEPQSIGQESSRGCIRMRNEDVEELYDMVTEGSRVLIR